MKKLTKKQMIATGAVAILAIGGVSAGVINHANNVHAQQVASQKAHDKKVKAEKLEKEKESKVNQLMNIASLNPTTDSIKAVTTAINDLKDKAVKSKALDLVKDLNARLALITQAQSALKDYQAHATDSNKQKVAQNAINAIKDKNDSEVKANFQKQFDAINAQAQKQANDAKQAQTATNQTASTGTPSEAASNAGASASNSSSVNNTASSDTNSYGGGTSQYTAPATNSGSASGYASSNTPSGNTNSGGSTSGGTAPSHVGGYGSIADANKAEQDAGNSSNHFAGGW